MKRHVRRQVASKTNPDVSRLDTNPTRKRGPMNQLPSLARRVSVVHLSAAFLDRESSGLREISTSQMRQRHKKSGGRGFEFSVRQLNPGPAVAAT